MIYVVTRTHDIKIYEILTTGENKKFDNICIKYQLKMDLNINITNIFSYNDGSFIYMYDNKKLVRIIYETRTYEIINALDGLQDIVICGDKLYTITNNKLECVDLTHVIQQ